MHDASRDAANPRNFARGALKNAVTPRIFVQDAPRNAITPRVFFARYAQKCCNF